MDALTAAVYSLKIIQCQLKSVFEKKRKIISLQCLEPVGTLGDSKGIRPVKTGCWFVDGDILTGALHVVWLSSNIIQNGNILVPITQSSWKKMAIKTEIERMRTREKSVFQCFDPVGWVTGKATGR